MSNVKTVVLPKDVKFTMVFTDGEYDKDATLRAANLVMEKYAGELANDQETVRALIATIRLEHGVDGVPVSSMPAGPLYADLHGRLGSLAPDADKGLFARNEVKIDAVLDEIAISSGKTGLRFATTEEITARKDVKAAKKRIRDARKAEEKKILDAYRASKGVTV